MRPRLEGQTISPQKVYTPKVTIGMPVYNGETFIRGAIDSVLSQTLADFELIISDNASIDATPDICKEYERRDRRICYVRQSENRGADWNFNFVLQKANGVHFTWVACDDVLDSYFLEETVNFMSQHNSCVLVASDFEIIDKDGSRIDIEELINIRSSIKWIKRCREFFSYPISNVYLCIYGLMKTEICKDVFQSLPKFKIFSGTELPVLARFAVKGEIASIPIALRKYRRHATSCYLTEVDKLSKLSMLRRKLIVIPHKFRIRFDQMTVLWSSSLSLDFKLLISIKVMFFYLRLVVSRAIKFPFKMIRSGWYKCRTLKQISNA